MLKVCSSSRHAPRLRRHLAVKLGGGLRASKLRPPQALHRSDPSVRTRSDITNAYWCIRILMPSKISSNAMYITYIAYIYTHTLYNLRLAMSRDEVLTTRLRSAKTFQSPSCHTLRSHLPTGRHTARFFAAAAARRAKVCKSPGMLPPPVRCWIWPKSAKTNQNHPNPCDERGGKCIWPSKKSQ